MSLGLLGIAVVASTCNSANKYKVVDCDKIWLESRLKGNQVMPGCEIKINLEDKLEPVSLYVWGWDAKDLCKKSLCCDELLFEYDSDKTTLKISDLQGRNYYPDDSCDCTPNMGKW